MYTIAIVNEKGGTGKTTTAVNLSAALGELGHKVLLVDLDGQAASSRWLGVEDDTTFAEALYTGRGLVPLADVIPNVSLAPASGKLDAVAHDLRPTQGGQLRKLLAEVADRYEYAIIDCPPSLGNRLIGNALLAASHAIVPVETSILALDGLKILLTTLDDVREGFGHDVILAGVVACRFDARTRLSRMVLEELKRALPGKVFETVIRENVKMRECPASGQSILTYAPDSHAAEDYRALAVELATSPRLAMSPQAETSSLTDGMTAAEGIMRIGDALRESVRRGSRDDGRQERLDSDWRRSLEDAKKRLESDEPDQAVTNVAAQQGECEVQPPQASAMPDSAATVLAAPDAVAPMQIGQAALVQESVEQSQTPARMETAPPSDPFQGASDIAPIEALPQEPTLQPSSNEVAPVPAAPEPQAVVVAGDAPIDLAASQEAQPPEQHNNAHPYGLHHNDDASAAWESTLDSDKRVAPASEAGSNSAVGDDVSADDWLDQASRGDSPKPASPEPLIVNESPLEFKLDDTPLNKAVSGSPSNTPAPAVAKPLLNLPMGETPMQQHHGEPLAAELSLGQTLDKLDEWGNIQTPEDPALQADCPHLKEVVQKMAWKTPAPKPPDKSAKRSLLSRFFARSSGK